MNGAATIANASATPHIRWMICRDLPEVLDIEAASFGAHAWIEPDFRRSLSTKTCIGMVAELGDQVVGYMVYELHKAKLDILNFAVHPSWRRRGVGRRMVSKLASKLSDHRRTSITLAVRETNLAAQLFFHSQGFMAERVIRGYFSSQPDEDAFLMRYRSRGV